MRFVFILLLFSFVCLAEEATIWGTIRQVEKSKIAHQYFIVYQENSKEYAYPMELNGLKVKGFVGKRVLVKGELEVRKVSLDGLRQDYPVLTTKSIREFSLKDLSIQSTASVAFKDLPRSKRSNSGGIRINDTVTNVAIFTGGALLVGTIIKEMIKGKK